MLFWIFEYDCDSKFWSFNIGGWNCEVICWGLVLVILWYGWGVYLEWVVVYEVGCVVVFVVFGEGFVDFIMEMEGFGDFLLVR